MKILKTIAATLVIFGYTTNSEAFRLICTDAEEQVKGDVVIIDTDKNKFEMLSGNKWNLPISNIDKTDHKIKLTLDLTHLKDMAKKQGEDIEGITYVAIIDRATLEMNLQLYKYGKPSNTTLAKANCRLVENKI